jgi:hypothetical protein
METTKNAHVAKMMSNPQKIVPRGPSVDSSTKNHGESENCFPHLLALGPFSKITKMLKIALFLNALFRTSRMVGFMKKLYNTDPR